MQEVWNTTRYSLAIVTLMMLVRLPGSRGLMRRDSIHFRAFAEAPMMPSGKIQNTQWDVWGSKGRPSSWRGENNPQREILVLIFHRERSGKVIRKGKKHIHRIFVRLYSRGFHQRGGTTGSWTGGWLAFVLRSYYPRSDCPQYLLVSSFSWSLGFCSFLVLVSRSPSGLMGVDILLG